MFKIGDLAVYPAHGVGRIESIESRSIGGASQDFFIMRILDSDMIIMIPVANIETVGLRQIITQEDAARVYSILRERDISLDNQTWNRRYREYMDKIKTGSVFEVAEVLRDLCLLKSDKDLSFGERKMLDTARSLLIKELAIAENLKEDAIANQLEGLFGS